MIDGKYKVKIIDLQDKYRFKIFCGYDDAGIKQDIEELQDEIDTINTNLALYSLITQTGYSVELELNNTNYQLSAKVKNKNGTVLSTSNIIDLPIESMIVNGSYDSATKSLILTLQNGNTITIPLADIIDGLVDEETFENAIEEVNTTIDNLDTRIEEEQSLQDQEIENLKTLRNILPKVSGSGESITLDNTGETSFYDIDIYGNTSQDGEPTPDTPQPIHSVSGDNTINIVGRNLLPVSGATSETINGITLSTDGNGLYTASGKLTTTSNTNKTFAIQPITLQAGTYYLHMRNTGTISTNVSIALRYNNSTIKYTTPSVANKIYEFTLSENTTINGIQLFVASGFGTSDTLNITFTPSIELTSEVTNYEPYSRDTYPINLPSGMELNSIRDYKDTFKLSDGTNLLDVTRGEIGGIDASGTEVVLANSWRATYFIEVKPNTSYTLTIENATRYSNSRAVRLYQYDENKAFISPRSEANSDKLTITTGSTTKYLKYTIYLGVNMTQEIAKDLKPMLNKGSTATPYQPYGVDKWYLEKNTNSIVLDGSEIYTGVWWDSSVPRIGARTDLHNALYPSSSDVYEEILGDKYKSYEQARLYLPSSSSNYVETGICIRANNSQLIIKNNNLTLASDTEQGAAQAIKEWVTTNGLKVVYPLAEPETIEITDTTLISQLNAIKNAISKKGQTNISQVNNDLPFELDVIAFKDMSNL